MGPRTPRKRIWKNSARDAILLALSVAHLATIVAGLLTWHLAPVSVKIIEAIVLTGLTAYNIIVISHLFTHLPWFTDERLNAIVSVLNSVNIGQSVQAYRFTHVRNHHRFTNDRRGSDGTTRDRSSTYRRGKDGDHQPLLAYAMGGAAESVAHRAAELAAVRRLWRVGAREAVLRSLATQHPQRRARELRQIQFDRAAHCLLLVLAAAISWQWTIFCYLPAWCVALALVNIQNYYRHFGANPDERTADSVSYYGRLYNLVTFNDGYHQEHHLAPGTHWSRMPRVRERFREQLDARPRVVSPVPAIVGFLDTDRPLLHRTIESGGSS